MVAKDSPILVVGAGTWGLSTALTLARDGFTDVTCFDKYPVPSPISAGNDSNKMIDYEYYEPGQKVPPQEYIRIEAKDLWASDPVYKPHYHPVGFIFAACSDEALASRKRTKGYKGADGVEYEYLSTPEQFRKHMPVLSGPMEKWQGYLLNKDDGWLHARNALKSAYAESVKLGVKFLFGDDGEIESLYTEGGKLLGVTAKSGKVFKGDKIAICAGASAVKLLDFKMQLQAKAFTLAHIQLTEEEAATFRDQPVLFNVERGFFFEADENTELKICNEFPGYTNLDANGDSIPLFTNEIPLEAAEAIRQFLRDTVPEYADRPFVRTRSCWCTDSPDRELILSQHPDYDNLVIGSGDSGMGFMLMPVIGKYITKLIKEGNSALTEEQQAIWKWRPETSSTRDNKQKRFGGKGVVTDLKEIKEWVSAENPEPHPFP